MRSLLSSLFSVLHRSFLRFFLIGNRMPETLMIKRGISSAYKKPARVSLGLSIDLSDDQNSDHSGNGKPVGVSGPASSKAKNDNTSFKKYLAVYVDGFSENLVEQGPFVAVTSDRASRPYSGISDTGIRDTGMNNKGIRH